MDIKGEARKYYYRSLQSDTNLTIRVPAELKKDFLAHFNGRGCSESIREHMINTIIAHKEKEE